MALRCKICSHPFAGPGLIAGANSGWSVADANKYATQFDFTFSEPTWYAHRNHVKAAADEPERDPDGPPAVTNTELLEAVRDFAMSEVRKGRTSALKDGLRAVQLLEARKNPGDEMGLLARLTTNNPPRIQIMDAVPDDEEMEP